MTRSVVGAAVLAATLVTGLSACMNMEEIAARDRTIEPKITVRVPEGSGPYPGVVLLHNCAGLDGVGGSQITWAWADFLVANGYAVALPDSFIPRNRIGGVCTSPGPQWVRQMIRGADAHKGREALQANPKVDRNRIGVMGGSNGGVATLAAVNARWITDNQWVAGGAPGFRAAIAFYPECGIEYGAWSGSSGSYASAAPLLILIGQLDDWTPVAPCEKMVAAAGGEPISMKVYPGAHHGFDNPNMVPPQFNPRASNRNRPSGGATTGTNPAAFADSKDQVLKFFAERLRGGS